MANNNYEYHALGSYKEELFRLIMNHELSEPLIDILMPSIEDERFDKLDNFLGGKFQYNEENGVSTTVYLKQHLLDVPFIYSTIIDTRNMICVDTSLAKYSQTIKQMNIEISILCHKASLEIDTGIRLKYKKMGYIGKNRLDIAVAILGDIINGSKEFGIGQLNPIPYNPVKSYYPSQDYFGKILNYSCDDFMKDYTLIK